MIDSGIIHEELTIVNNETQYYSTLDSKIASEGKTVNEVILKETD